MKTVVVNEPNNQVALSRVSEDRYYGISTPVSKGFMKGFITRTNYNGGDFIAVARNYLTNGNGWTALRAYSLKETIKKVVNEGYVVYEFDTHTELFKWLAE